MNEALEDLARATAVLLTKHGLEEFLITAEDLASLEGYATVLVREESGMVLYLLSEERCAEMAELTQQGLTAPEAAWITVGATRLCIHCDTVAAWSEGRWTHDTPPMDGHEAEVVSRSDDRSAR